MNVFKMHSEFGLVCNFVTYIYIHIASVYANTSSFSDDANVSAPCVNACLHVCNYPFPQPSGPTTMKGCLC